MKWFEVYEELELTKNLILKLAFTGRNIDTGKRRFSSFEIAGLKGLTSQF